MKQLQQKKLRETSPHPKYPIPCCLVILSDFQPGYHDTLLRVQLSQVELPCFASIPRKCRTDLNWEAAASEAGCLTNPV